jgi:hypothetical protein
VTKLVFGQDPAAKKKARQENDDPLRQRRDAFGSGPAPTTCCLCSAPLPAGHRLVCHACGVKGGVEAVAQLEADRFDRVMNGLPEHGGGKWLEAHGTPKGPLETKDDGSGSSTIESAWRHGVPMSSIERR